MSRRTQDASRVHQDVAYRIVTFFDGPFQTTSAILISSHVLVLQPQQASSLVWAPPVSLAATQGIDFSFSSCRYLDVSVPCVTSLSRTALLKAVGSPIRISTALCLLTAPRSISSFVTSFFGS